MLYGKMKAADFYTDIKSILIEIHPERRELLSMDFAYTYLVFDMDPQHERKFDKGLPALTIAEQNAAKLTEMVDYFTDETDPTIGKLYINYPMMESFRDCESFDDITYIDRAVNIDEIKKYKETVSSRRMSGRQLNTYTKEYFLKLAKLNVTKLHSKINGLCSELNYETYRKESEQTDILKQEGKFMRELHKIFVLNTSLFLPLDYIGNKNGFFDRFLKNNDVSDKD